MRETKYDALGRRLASSGLEQVRLTYAELDALCGLPPTAYKDRPFWANTWRSNHAKSWLQEGYVVDEVSLGSFVVFQYAPAQAKDPGRGRKSVGYGTRRGPVRKKEKPDIDIPRPCSEELEKGLLSWQQLEDYVVQEEALDELFLRRCPENRSLSDVLLKVATLNTFYSTNIFTVTPVARHILKLDIDSRLAAGDLTLVEDLQRIEIGGKGKRFYSFATKYCSHHAPHSFPIYDSYVDKILRYFRDTDGFCDFRNVELKSYKRFCEIIFHFRDAYGLQEYSVKDIDKYLWQLGKKYFPNQYNQRKMKSSVK